MFRKVLVANRGEIALRIIRACKELGIATVAIHSEADRPSLHVRFADEGVCIGPAPPASSYLDPKRIIAAAEITNSDAIHPGYGFLAENGDFAEICEACNIKFIGPSATVIRLMGDKIKAKEAMKKVGLPVIPGSEGIIKTLKEAVDIAKAIGFPVILKAALGGGGKGMRMACDSKELETYFEIAQQEAKLSFGVEDLYIEKCIDSARHIEFQVLGDSLGNIIHLGDRDCTIQRRHQKLIEESPSPVVDEALREKMGNLVVKGAKAIGYENSGTMEFLLDKENNFYFMEMNTRIQVEHTVTEEVVDIDLIKEQIRIAWGEKLSLTQDQVVLKGHAIECRINAEDPGNDFLPCPGEITSLHIPGGHGIRIDTHAYAKYKIPPYYDSMIAKVITHGKNRQEAVLKMQRALDEFIIEGVKTTIPFHKEIICSPVFLFGNYDTSLIERFINFRGLKEKEQEVKT
ncbi:MAG: acetyl-CoA carboxylase biotin carboxylase subunit [candidate division Zixibacteria bacterium RBG_16_40_9]|nr:MAG: acetyl-CoA carboxylase biotin carboxylase subunit [candidate division Zixibacteria bacterium RBG_16_40_9]